MSSGRALKDRASAPLRGARIVRSALRLLGTHPAVVAIPAIGAAQLIAGVVLVGPLMLDWVNTWMRPEASGVVSMVLTLAVVGMPCSIVDAYLDVVALLMLREAQQGGRATLRAGVRAANRRIRAIGAWSVVLSGSVAGRALLSLVPGARAVRWAGGLAFELATFFVAPVIAFEEHDARGTFRRSAELIRRNARRALAPTAGVLVACAPAFMPGLVLIWAAHIVPASAWIPGEPYPAADGQLLVMGVVALAPGGALVAVSCLLLRFALYERATGGTIPAAYSARDLEAALPA